MNLRPVMAASVLLTLSPAASIRANEGGPESRIGKPAPPLGVRDWLDGDKIETFEPGHIYIVELWATWCEPCVASFPKVVEAQKRYAPKKVHFAAVSAESPGDVRRFLRRKRPDGKRWSEYLNFSIGADPDGSFSRDYFHAFRQNALGATFIIGRDGTLQWVGVPRENYAAFDDALEKIVAGNWNAEEFAQDFAAGLERRAKLQKLEAKLNTALNQKEEGRAASAIEEIKSVAGTDPEFPIAAMFLLARNERWDASIALGEHILETCSLNVPGLNLIAWNLATLEGRPESAVELARAAMAKASKLPGYEDAEILDTHARVCAEMKDYDCAVDRAEAALKLTPEADNLRYRKSLRDYQRRQKGGD